jgi:hypothetical protein
MPTKVCGEGVAENSITVGDAEVYATDVPLNIKNGRFKVSGTEPTGTVVGTGVVPVITCPFLLMP